MKPSTATDALSPPLARLAAEPPGTWSFRRLWKHTPLPLRKEAVTVTLGGDSTGAVRGELLEALATVAGFRRRTIERMEPAEAARFAGRIPARRLPHPEAVFGGFLTEARVEMLAAYVEGVGLRHEQGRVLDDDVEVDPAAARAAAEALLERFPPDEVVVYLIALSLGSPSLAPEIPEWITARFEERSREPGAGTEEGLAPVEAVDPEDAPDPELVREAREEIPEDNAVPGSPFTALDRLLIRAAVDCAQEVEGAADRDTVEDMVDEVVELNSTRHASFFHRGFVDSLFGAELREDLPAENDRRRHWYLAGWLSALARREQFDETVALLDGDAHVRALSDSGSAAGALALPLLFRALCRAGREPEAARLLSVGDLLRNPTLIPHLLEEGTRLLREDDAVRARPFFDRLGEVVQRLEDLGEPTTERFFLEIRRRRAHCFRQLGEAERARELLERLLSEDPDPAVQAMVLADLGLLDARYRALADVRLWRSDQERHDVVNGLEAGRARFEAAVGKGGRYASHGGWPLGVLHLAREEWTEARKVLSMVLSSFLEHAQRYRGRRLLANVRVATGVAQALEMEYNRLPGARALLLLGIQEGARIPPPLLPHVLDALDEHADDLAGEVLERVLAMEEDEVLDVLGASKLVRTSPGVARRLLARAGSPQRRSSEQAADLRHAVEIFLAASPPELEGARDALDRLEALARSGIAQEEYLALLSDPTQVDPAWDPEDAAWSRIAILESRGDCESAISALRARFNAVLAEDGWSAGEEARAILARARSYDLGPEWTEDLEGRLDAWVRELHEGEEVDGPVRSGLANQSFRILIVGGDERQHELEERVRRKLDEDGDTISVTHIPTGWSGNWAHKLDEVLRTAERHDGLVLLRFMRTEFGRSLRASLGDRPWVHCPGGGTLQVTRMVRKAARFAAS